MNYWFNNNIVRLRLSAAPIAVADAGALHGMQGRWKKLSPHVRFFGFEPQDENTEESLGSDGGRSGVALSSEPGKGTLYITRKMDGSSFLEPDFDSMRRFATADRYDVVATQESVPLGTLDDELGKHGITRIDFLKADTQGTELDVLRGAQKVIRETILGIEVEINLISRYSGQAYFSDIDMFLRERGFEIMDLSRRFMSRRGGLGAGQTKGQLTHGTALYLRPLESASGIIGSYPESERASAVVRFASIAMVYGYVDIAADIISGFRNVFERDEASALINLISEGRERRTRRRIPLLDRAKSAAVKLIRAIEKIENRQQTGDWGIGGDI